MKDVIVVGVNYSNSLGVIRSLGEAGYGVRLLTFNRATKLIAGSSKYVTRSLNVGFHDDDIVKGLNMLRGSDDRILVMPLYDTCCEIIDRNHNRLSEHFILPRINYHALTLTDLMDKMRQKELARECGLPIAEGNKFSSEDGKINYKDIAYPCFLKPLLSAEIQGPKSAFAICRDEKELESAVRFAKSKGCEKVLIEQYLKIQEELSLYGVAGNGQVFLPVCIETIRGGFAQHQGVAAEGLAVSANTIRDVKEKVEKLVKTIELSGLFCVDLIKSNGEIYFSEINLRSGGSGYAATLAGANLPGTLANLEYLGSTSGPEDIEKPIRFLNERLEFDAYIGGFISERDYKTHLADHTERFVQNDLDPMPWRWFQLYCAKMKAAKMMRRS